MPKVACFFSAFSNEHLYFRGHHFHLCGCHSASKQADWRLGTAPEACVLARQQQDDRKRVAGLMGRKDRKPSTGLPLMLHFLSSGVPCTDNDYKLWSPSDERGNECLLGHKTVFKRRTPHATCFNGEDFDRPVVVSNCSCTREDYEWLVLHQFLGI